MSFLEIDLGEDKGSLGKIVTLGKRADGFSHSEKSPVTLIGQIKMCQTPKKARVPSLKSLEGVNADGAARAWMH
jgi:hypothetical protein